MAETTLPTSGAATRVAHPPLELTPRAPWLVALTWLTPIALVASQAWFIMASAPDRDMGHLQKIMYVHVPAAWNAFLAFLWVFIQSIRYLFTRDERADLQADRKSVV